MPVRRSPAQRLLESIRTSRPPDSATRPSGAPPRALPMRYVASRAKPYPPHSPRRVMTPGTASRRLPDPLPLVGRTDELGMLEALLEEGREGPSVVFVRGEGGVGKSRLATELAERATRRTWTVATGRAYPVERGVPYALFSDAWLPILKEMDSSTLTLLSRGGDAELKYLFPALGSGHEDRDDIAGGEPEEFRTRLMWTFAEFMKKFAARSPLLCVLEDVQWADESSLQLIHFLARQTVGAPILILCTYNDQERERAPHLVQTEMSLAGIGLAHVIQLEAFTLDQVTELVCRTFGVDIDVVREFSALLYGWTRGNAFFVEEIVKSLVASGRLRSENGTWTGWDAKEFGMPGSVRDAVMSRVRALSEPAQTVAELAAIVGARATYPLLESISGLDANDLLSALEELCGNRILNERAESGVVVYDFAHPLVQQILYGEFSLQRARILHGAVAEAMEAYYGPKAPEHADELAFHFARTDGGDLRAKATKYLAAAGRRALERHADHEAIAYLEAALERARETAPDGAPALADVVPYLARAHTRIGNFDVAAQLWTATLEQIPPDHPQHLALRRTLGMTHIWRGHHDEAQVQFAAGLEAAEAVDDRPATVRLLVAKAHCLQELGRGAEAIETLRPALPLAEALGDPRLLARVHRSLALLHVWVGPPERAVEHGERAIELASQVGDLSIEFWARWGLAVLDGCRGDTEGMGRAIKEINDLAKQSPVLRLWTADMSVELAYVRGDWDTGIALGEQAISLARSLNQRTLLPRLLVWTSQFHVARNELERAWDLVGEAIEISGLDSDGEAIDVHRVVPTYIGLAYYRLALGEYEAAIEAAEKGLEIAEGTGYVLWSITRVLPVLVEACLWAGHLDRAQEVGTRMREHAERIDHKIGLAWADACDSLIIWKRGDSAGAVDLMQQAADALEAIPMIWSATCLRRQLAGRYAEIGRIEDAKRELDRVHGWCVHLGAALELEKTRAMYREVGLRAPPVQTPDGPLGLTPAEFDVARLVASGRSNKAIAAQRDRAVRTVSTQLSGIYEKLGIGGPGARVRLGNLLRDEGFLE